jgi:hypothetical protein
MRGRGPTRAKQGNCASIQYNGHVVFRRVAAAVQFDDRNEHEMHASLVGY